MFIYNYFKQILYIPEAVRRGEIKTRRLDEIAASLGLDD